MLSREALGLFPSIPLTEDAFKRRVSYLRVSVTDKCNLHCRYCMPDGRMEWLPNEGLLDKEELFQLIDAFICLGVTKIRLTGGEPLLRSDLPEILSCIKKRPEIQDVALSTNGLLLAPMVLPLFKAGLRRINISLDTFLPDRFIKISRQGELKRILEGIKEAVRVGLHPIKLNNVAMRGINDDEIEAFALYAAEHAVEVRFIELMPTSYTEEGRAGVGREHYMSSEEVRSCVEKAVQLGPEDPRTGVAQVYPIVGGAGKIGFISPVSNHFCGSCNRLRLTAAGMLKTCLHGSEMTDLCTPLRNGASKEELAGLIREAVMKKPEEHFIRDKHFVSKSLKMSQVGG